MVSRVFTQLLLLFSVSYMLFYVSYSNCKSSCNYFITMLAQCWKGRGLTTVAFLLLQHQIPSCSKCFKEAVHRTPGGALCQFWYVEPYWGCKLAMGG